MRDPNRIDRILELLRTYWKDNPDLRLGQIVVNLTPDRFRESCLCTMRESCHVCSGGGLKRDPFHVEDHDWETILRHLVTNIAKDQK